MPEIIQKKIRAEAKEATQELTGDGGAEVDKLESLALSSKHGVICRISKGINVPEPQLLSWRMTVKRIYRAERLIQ